MNARQMLYAFAVGLLALVHWGCGSPTTAGYADVLGDAKQCQLTVYSKTHSTIFDARVHSGDT